MTGVHVHCVGLYTNGNHQRVVFIGFTFYVCNVRMNLTFVVGVEKSYAF